MMKMGERSGPSTSWMEQPGKVLRCWSSGWVRRKKKREPMGMVLHCLNWS